ncbi:hypothetical protein GUJ93_ZPchr0007g5304 [Zizania palustris]|uniref:Uncharacterized protein n=1 Tax=Zizania palustris TaxID=103762 RepID=A0A8J5T755_ZIZPA|nr:hypothetical protein GUJ93_ZPchr0007g5304 [Zizania palustris]
MAVSVAIVDVDLLEEVFTVDELVLLTTTDLDLTEEVILAREHAPSAIADLTTMVVFPKVTNFIPWDLMEVVTPGTYLEAHQLHFEHLEGQIMAHAQHRVLLQVRSCIASLCDRLLAILKKLEVDRWEFYTLSKEFLCHLHGTKPIAWSDDEDHRELVAILGP